MKTKLFLLLLCLFVGACAGSAVEPAVKLTGKDAENDRVTVQAEGKQAIVDVYSEHGIGSAEISALDGKWPRELVLRLHLAGLETFEVRNDQILIHTALSSTAPYTQFCTVMDRSSPIDEPLDEDSQYWLPLQIVPEQETGTPDLPLENGYFELIMPDSLFESEPETIFIRWIDYFRG